MKKVLLTLLIALLSVSSSFAYQRDSIVGLWKTIDDETNEAKSLVQIYEYHGRYFGRVVHLFKDSEKIAKDIIGDPKIVGLDIVWNMVKDFDYDEDDEDDKEWDDGKILDPKSGRVYSCKMWRSGPDLIVRGKFGPFGRNQIWVQASKEENAKFSNNIEIVPSIPRQK